MVRDTVVKFIPKEERIISGHGDQEKPPCWRFSITFRPGQLIIIEQPAGSRCRTQCSAGKLSMKFGKAAIDR
jgi:hypothetical protein